MPHLTQPEIDSANAKSLADFLLSRSVPLEKISNQYLWREENVWIHENEWYSHYEQTGGLAVSFVMKYFNKTFQEAVVELNGDRFSVIEALPKTEPKPPSSLIAPPRNSSTYRMYMYLRNVRCIDGDVINHFVNCGLLYEDSEHHNCVFVGRDKNGNVKHIHKRSTVSGFRQTVSGSRAEYAFHFSGNDNTVYVFEAPIDMLAFVSMHKESWQEHSYVALCSVSEKALVKMLETNKNLSHIVLCLDNDNAGQAANERIKQSLENKDYTDIEILVPQNKDWDEDIIKLKKEVKEIQCRESKYSLSLGV